MPPKAKKTVTASSGGSSVGASSVTDRAAVATVAKEVKKRGRPRLVRDAESQVKPSVRAKKAEANSANVDGRGPSIATEEAPESSPSHAPELHQTASQATSQGLGTEQRGRDRAQAVKTTEGLASTPTTEGSTQSVLVEKSGDKAKENASLSASGALINDTHAQDLNPVDATVTSLATAPPATPRSASREEDGKSLVVSLPSVSDTTATDATGATGERHSSGITDAAAVPLDTATAHLMAALFGWHVTSLTRVDGKAATPAEGSRSTHPRVQVKLVHSANPACTVSLEAPLSGDPWTEDGRVICVDGAAALVTWRECALWLSGQFNAGFALGMAGAHNASGPPDTTPRSIAATTQAPRSVEHHSRGRQTNAAKLTNAAPDHSSIDQQKRSEGGNEETQTPAQDASHPPPRKRGRPRKGSITESTTSVAKGLGESPIFTSSSSSSGSATAESSASGADDELDHLELLPRRRRAKREHVLRGTVPELGLPSLKAEHANTGRGASIDANTSFAAHFRGGGTDGSASLKKPATGAAPQEATVPAGGIGHGLRPLVQGELPSAALATHAARTKGGFDTSAAFFAYSRAEGKRLAVGLSNAAHAAATAEAGGASSTRDAKDEAEVAKTAQLLTALQVHHDNDAEVRKDMVASVQTALATANLVGDPAFASAHALQTAELEARQWLAPADPAAKAEKESTEEGLQQPAPVPAFPREPPHTFLPVSGEALTRAQDRLSSTLATGGSPPRYQTLPPGSPMPPAPRIEIGSTYKVRGSFTVAAAPDRAEGGDNGGGLPAMVANPISDMHLAVYRRFWPKDVKEAVEAAEEAEYQRTTQGTKATNPTDPHATKTETVSKPVDIKSEKTVEEEATAHSQGHVTGETQPGSHPAGKGDAKPGDKMTKKQARDLDSSEGEREVESHHPKDIDAVLRHEDRHIGRVPMPDVEWRYQA